MPKASKTPLLTSPVSSGTWVCMLRYWGESEPFLHTSAKIYRVRLKKEQQKQQTLFPFWSPEVFPFILGAGVGEENHSCCCCLWLNLAPYEAWLEQGRNISIAMLPPPALYHLGTMAVAGGETRKGKGWNVQAAQRKRKGKREDPYLLERLKKSSSLLLWQCSLPALVYVWEWEWWDVDTSAIPWLHKVLRRVSII